jgi:hypothetical protein
VTPEASPPLSLDVVRARIFYLACDVEPVSPPAAMLLRAVADAIEEGSGSTRLGDAENGQTTPLFAHVANLRRFSERAAGTALGVVRELEGVGAPGSEKR